MNSEPVSTNQNANEVWKPRETTAPKLGELSLAGEVEVSAQPEEQKPALIKEVPGFARIESPNIPPGPAVGWDRPVTVVDFKGDPSKVLGHPSNPTSKITQAYVDSSKKQ